MRTNVVIDNKLIEEAFRYAQVNTKRELIHLALQEFVTNHKRRDIRHLRGKIKLRDDYNHKLLRKDRE